MLHDLAVVYGGASAQLAGSRRSIFNLTGYSLGESYRFITYRGSDPCVFFSPSFGLGNIYLFVGIRYSSFCFILTTPSD